MCSLLRRSFVGSATGGYNDLIEQTDVEDTYALQFMQMSVPQFCLGLLDKLVPCLGGVASERLALHGVELLHRVTSLLQESVFGAALWNDNSVPACELVRPSSF